MNVVRRLRLVELDDGVCEALKWIAFLAMVADHVSVVFFGRDVPLLNPIGRLAMPIFCLVFGYNLARPGVEYGRVLRRLLWVGLLAQPLAILSINRGDLLPLNILLTFAVAVSLLVSSPLRWWTWLLVLGVMAVTVDYSLVGVGLLLASVCFWRARTVLSACGLLVMLACLNLWNGNAWAWLGVALVLAGTRFAFDFPRWPRLFLYAYPAHLLVLAVLASL